MLQVSITKTNNSTHPPKKKKKKTIKAEGQWHGIMRYECRDANSLRIPYKRHRLQPKLPTESRRDEHDEHMIK